MVMQVSVEKLSQIGYKLNIVIPDASVQEAIQDRIASLSKNVSIPGFRKGKVPAHIVKQRYKNELDQEALTQVIQKSIEDALKQEEIRAIGMPDVKFKRPPVVGQDVEFSAEVETLPTITSIEFSLSELEQPKTDIVEEDLTRTLDQLCKQGATWNTVEREAKLRDRVAVDFYPIVDGKEEKDKGAKNRTIELGSGSLIAGFEEGLIGMRAGEEKTLDLTLPNDFPDAEQAGKPVQFVVHLKNVYQADIPELNEAFIKKLGVESGDLNELRANIQKTLEQERDRLIRERVKKQVFDHLIEKNDILVPKSMVQNAAKNLHDEIYGQDHNHDHHHHSQEEMQQLSDVAKRRVMLGLLITEKAKQLDLKPDHNKVEMRARDIASVYQDPESVFQWLMTDAERKTGIEAQILEDQVTDHFLGSVTLKERVLTYAELKGIQV